MFPSETTPKIAFDRTVLRIKATFVIRVLSGCLVVSIILYKIIPRSSGVTGIIDSRYDIPTIRTPSIQARRTGREAGACAWRKGLITCVSAMTKTDT